MDTIKIIELPGRSSAERDDWKEAAAGRQNMPMEGDEEAIPTYRFSPLLL
jgi:hypothetical protein